MQVSVEITSGLERRLTIGVPADRVETEVDARLQKAAQNVRLKGFRPGKVPIKVVKQRFGAGVRQEVLGEVMSQSFYEAVSQESLRPAGQPSIEPRNMSEGKDLEFVATFEIYPDVELVDFTTLEIEKPVAEVSDDDIDNMLDILRKQQSTWETVERASQDGDKVNIDYAGTKEGEAFEGGTAEGSDLVLGSGQMIPGFESGIEGLAAGEERVLSLSFPDDYHSEELKGAAVEFTVKVNAVTEQTLPELDDDFFVKFGVNEGGLDAFKAEVRANMERELKQALRNKLKGRTLDALLERTEVDVPKSLIAGEIGGLRQQMLRQFGQQAANIDASVLPDEMFQAQAEKRVALGLVLGEIIRKEELKANGDRVRETIEELASSYEEPSEVVDWYYSNEEQLSGVEASVLEDQAVDMVLDRAQVTEVACSYQEALNPDAQAAEEEESENAGESE